MIKDFFCTVLIIGSLGFVIGLVSQGPIWLAERRQRKAFPLYLYQTAMDKDWEVPMGDEEDAFARNSDPQTSHDAASIVRATQLEEVVYGALKEHGPMTSIEVADRLRISPWSISPRFAPLERKGYIERTGERRKNPHTGRGKGLDVWQVKPPKETPERQSA